METVASDVRFAVRLIRKAPAASIVTILTLALGTGLNAGVFNVLNGMLFRPRVTVDPGSFVHLQPWYSGDTAPRHEAPQFTTRDYQALAERTASLDALAAWTVRHARMGDERGSDMMLVLASCNFFGVYGLDRLERGRTFRPEECRASGAPVAVIGDYVWRTWFAADPDILDRPLELDRQRFTIVGVAPPDFAGRVRGEGIWIPYADEPLLARGRPMRDDPARAWLWSEGRLRPGIGAATAQAELNVLMRQQDRLVPGRTTTIELTNGAMIHEPGVRPVAVFVVPLVLGSVGLLLLISAGNVALLLLARALARRREIAIRLAIGCGRARLLRMLLTESLLFGLLGIPLGAWVAWNAPAVLRSLIPAMPFYPMQPDAAVFIYLTALSLIAGVAAGLTPALESVRQRLTPALGGQGAPTGAGGSRTRDVLMALQIAMSVVLLAGAALFVRVEASLMAPDPSVDAAHVMLANYDPPPPSSRVSLATVAARLQALPGVRSVAFAHGGGGS